MLKEKLLFYPKLDMKYQFRCSRFKIDQERSVEFNGPDHFEFLPEAASASLGRIPSSSSRTRCPSPSWTRSPSPSMNFCGKILVGALLQIGQSNSSLIFITLMHCRK